VRYIVSESISSSFFFLTPTAGNFTGNSRAAFPFTLAAREDQTIFSLDSVPENFSLSDPDHLTAAQINELCNHWLARQRRGLAPFVVTNASPLHAVPAKPMKNGKGKEKMKYVHVNTDDESVVEEEEDGNVRDEAEGEPQALKYGPPTGRGLKNPPSLRFAEKPIAEAGPSHRKAPKASKDVRKAKKPKQVEETAEDGDVGDEDGDETNAGGVENDESSGEDEEDGSLRDKAEEESQAVKYGPPARKGGKNASLKQSAEKPIPDAGPSNGAPAKAPKKVNHAKKPNQVKGVSKETAEATPKKTKLGSVSRPVSHPSPSE
jgi:hypothetical protein